MTLNKQEFNYVKAAIKLTAFGVAMLIGIVWTLSAGKKMYNVWSEAKDGQAEFAKAEFNRKIKILEAEAARESAEYLSQAEIIRAQGVAEANRIIGGSLKENESYLRYLWIQSLDHGKATVVYVPTEANLPILEAGRNP